MTSKPKPSRTKTGGKTKASIVTRLLSRDKGVTIVELTNATGWQPHSCRAFLTGLRKKGHAITREDRGDGVTAYCMTAAPAPAVADEHSAAGA
ncbi:MAG: DUF3489 domain-containing protein [Pseudorhodoplanes sp.]